MHPINRRDLAAPGELMTEGHVLTDSDATSSPASGKC
jgi:hypothetical protein